jgi:hypothetical protein
MVRRKLLLALGATLILGAVAFYFGFHQSPGGQVVVTAPQHATTTPDIATTSPVSTPVTTIPNTPDTGAVIHVAGKDGWKAAIATVFWVGEGATADNDYIQNSESAWDEQWATHFGGVDDPDKRCGFKPCVFTPKENAFYVALPYNDLDDNGDKKSSSTVVPWHTTSVKSDLKNHWVEVSYKNGASCYGQWQDVGPYYETDSAYVFGTAAKPKNTFDAKAGIDLSPAMRDCLKVGDISNVTWRFVNASKVPTGPWKTTVTTRLSQ